MVIRRMKPLGFTLEQMRDLLDATDRLDSDGALGTGEREALLERVQDLYRQAAAERVKNSVSSWNAPRTSPTPWGLAWSRTLWPPASTPARTSRR